VVATKAFFDEVFEAIDPILDEVFAKLFLYVRGETQIELQASLRAHDIEVEVGQNAIDSWHGHNFELRADALVITGNTITPTVGDEIWEPLDSGWQVYKIMPPGNSKRCFEPVDAEEIKLLVYAKKTRTEAAT
jgi:hypothetical protein